MPVSFFIALRYFFSKSKQTIINLINAISISVILVATAALFIVLSAFSGLKTFGLSFSSSFDPDVRIEAAEGKIITVDSSQLKAIAELRTIVSASPILEEKVFLRFKNKNHVAYLKGVDQSYTSVVNVDSLIISGNWLSNDFDDVVIGAGIARTLSLGVYDYTDFLTLTVPKRETAVSLTKNPFNNESVLVSGIFFANEDIDKKYLFGKIELAQRLLQRNKNQFSSIELKTTETADLAVLQTQVSSLLGQAITAKSRVQLNAALYKMLNTENIAVYLIFSLVIIIALFNVVGALIMMFLDKKPQLSVFYAMGLLPKEIRQVFFILGGLISWVGGTLGIVLGTVMVLIQQHLPFLYVPGTNLPYPVEFTLWNFFLVILTLFSLGGLASFWATRGMDKKIVVH
ncbi:MAG: ABC transporter permease [Flavobacteriaceae bacterium]